ncbi:MAG TPA: nitroreductase family protein [Leptolinea sp.]
MPFQHPFSQIVHQRYSSRSYQADSGADPAFRDLADFITTLPSGPFNGPSRFQLAVANDDDQNALRGLGTYGTIKNPPGYIIGATRSAEKDLEDFGYRMEMIVLKAAELGLGTCWLGGLFTRSTFAKKISAVRGERIPAICSVGIPDVKKTLAEVDLSRKRFGWELLFFNGDFSIPLKAETSGAYAGALELLRLAPSAQDLQPWRVLKHAENWHFYMQRTRGYHEMVMTPITGIPDLQRIDMGIGMAHFEQAAMEAGMSGKWQMIDPKIPVTNKLMEYSVSWITGGIK